MPYENTAARNPACELALLTQGNSDPDRLRLALDEFLRHRAAIREARFGSSRARALAPGGRRGGASRPAAISAGEPCEQRAELSLEASPQRLLLLVG